MHIQNNTATHGTPPSLAAPHSLDIEQGQNNRSLVALTKEEELSVFKWTSADIALHVTGHVLALAVAAIQLANRNGGLNTTAEKLAVPTALFSAGDIFASSYFGCHARTLLAYGDRNNAANIDLIRLLASGFGVALPALVLADPGTNAANKAHEVLSGVTIATIAIAMIFTTAKWGRGNGFAPRRQGPELELSNIQTPPNNAHSHQNDALSVQGQTIR